LRKHSSNLERILPITRRF